MALRPDSARLPRKSTPPKPSFNGQSVMHGGSPYAAPRPTSFNAQSVMHGGSPLAPLPAGQGPAGQGKYVRPNPVAPSAPRAPSSGARTGVGTNATGAVSAFSAAAGGGMGGGGMAAGAPPGMSEEDWLAQDAEFIDTRANAEREFQNLVAQMAQQRAGFELDNKNALKNLGWVDEDGTGPGEGRWNQNDRLTGYGNAFQNQLGDFASRGMLESSLYGSSLNDLNRGFNQQRDDLGTALQQFLTGQNTEQAQAQSSRDAAIVAAQRQALARMAASLGL